MPALDAAKAYGATAGRACFLSFEARHAVAEDAPGTLQNISLPIAKLLRSIWNRSIWNSSYQFRGMAVAGMCRRDETQCSHVWNGKPSRS
jgi:hypothetical protein